LRLRRRVSDRDLFARSKRALPFPAVTDERTPSTSSGLFGLALAACIALPFDPDTGKSVLAVILEAFGENWINGLMIAMVIAPPYAIGLFVGIATFTRERYGVTFLKIALVLIHLELLIIALMIVQQTQNHATLALLGFAIVMVVRLLGRAARSRRLGTHASLGWLARTGGVLVAGVFGWMRLQAHGVDIGIALTATLVTAALMAITARPAPR
jgi:hypothetical protein